MHCDSPELPTLDDFVDDLQIDLYLNGLQMAAMLGAQLREELANGPDENSLKKWYTWTRGLNQLQTFRYAPARQSIKEQKQRGRPAQEPKIHLNGPAPQLRNPATPKAQTQPVPETVNATSAACDPSDPYVPYDPYAPSGLLNSPDLHDPSGPINARTSPAPSPGPTSTSACAPDTPTPAAPQTPRESQKLQKAEETPSRPATPTNPAKFDQINSLAGNGRTPNLTPASSGQFDQLNAYVAGKHLRSRI